MGSRVGVESKPWCSRFWLGIMPSTKMALPPLEPGYRLVVEVEALANAEEDNGWTVLATTIDAEVCPDVDILQA